MKLRILLDHSGIVLKSLLATMLAVLAINCWADNPPLTDTTPPTLIDFSFNPSEVDVSTGSAEVNVNLHITDDLSGFSHGWIGFYSPSYGQYVEGLIYLQSGTPQDAEVSTTLTIPQFSEAGDWVAYSIQLTDNVGNSQYLDSTALADLGFSTVLAVSSAMQDTSPPQLTGLSLDPSTIDVSSGSQPIVITMDIVDSPAGVDFSCESVCYYFINLGSPSGKQIQYELELNATQVSGTAESGRWQIIVTLPQYAEAGTWHINSLQLRDKARNINYLTASHIQSLGLPATFSVASSLSDTEAPQLVSVDISPKFVDTTASSATITGLLQATDNLSGIVTASSSISPNALNSLFLYFRSPSGNQTLYLNPQNLVAGSVTNGTWQIQGNLPRFSEAGTWRLDYVIVGDNAGNRVTYDNAQLAALGVPNLEVILPSHEIDGAVSDVNTDTVIKDDVFQERAQVIIPANVLTEPTMISIDVLSSDLNLPIPVGFSTTGTNFVNIKLDPYPVPPYPAPGITLVLPVSNQTAPGTLLTLYRVDPASGNLTPEPSIVHGQPVTGTVNADGLSATFTGVAALSTVVGLVPSGEVLGDLNGDFVVDCADIAIVQNAFGKKLNQEGFDSRADINRDNVVNIRDLSSISRQLPRDTVCRITPEGAVRIEPQSPAAH